MCMYHWPVLVAPLFPRSVYALKMLRVIRYIDVVHVCVSVQEFVDEGCKMRPWQQDSKILQNLPVWQLEDGAHAVTTQQRHILHDGSGFINGITSKVCAWLLSVKKINPQSHVMCLCTHNWLCECLTCCGNFLWGTFKWHLKPCAINVTL